MLFEYQQLQSFFVWCDKHPIIGTIVTCGMFLLLAVLLYLNQCTSNPEKKDQNRKAEWER